MMTMNIGQSNLNGTGHLTSVSCANCEKTRHLWSFLIVLSEGDKPTRLVEHFNLYFHENYPVAPVLFFGSLEQAVNEAFEATSTKEVGFVPNISQHWSFNRSSIVHCWSIFITTGVCTLLFSAWRSSAKSNWLTISWIVTSSGLEMSRHRRIRPSRQGPSERTELILSLRLKFATWWSNIFPSSNFTYLYALTNLHCWSEWCGLLWQNPRDPLQPIINFESFCVVTFCHKQARGHLCRTLWKHWEPSKKSRVRVRKFR